jgi:NAD(P)H-hydrate epimerase
MKRDKSNITKIEKMPKLPPRPADSHKGNYGRILILGGSRGFIGAPALAASAALRTGAGLVRMALPETIQLTSAAIEPCATSLALPEDAAGRISLAALEAIFEAVAVADVLAVGPGLDRSDDLEKILHNLWEKIEIPMVIDADGLNNLANSGTWIEKTANRSNTVLTPHPGEFSRLWDAFCEGSPPEDRSEAAAAMAVKMNAIIVLKGHKTVVTDARKIYVNDTGNPGMATGGTGDVLTGMIAALLGQGMDGFDAAVLATWLHGKAGDIAAEEIGQISTIASDLLQYIPAAIKEHRK